MEDPTTTETGTGRWIGRGGGRGEEGQGGGGGRDAQADEQTGPLYDAMGKPRKPGTGEGRVEGGREG